MKNLKSADGKEVLAEGEPYHAAAVVAPSEPDIKKPAAPTPVAGRRLFRTAYWLVWFVVVPVALACLSVWALAPPGGTEPTGALGWLQNVVREQPVPIIIVAFTLFEAVDAHGAPREADGAPPREPSRTA